MLDWRGMCLHLSTREDAEQEAEVYGDGHRRKRILPDCLFCLVCGLHRLVLGAIDLLVGDARNRRGQSLNIGANAVDLISQLIAAAIELRREGTLPFLYLLSHTIFSVSVPLLDSAFEYLTASVDCSQVVVGKFSPLLFDVASNLLPISFQLIPVHVTSFRAQALHLIVNAPREGLQH